MVKPLVVTTIAAAQQAVDEARRKQLIVGLVPTMGALHEGHASLFHTARLETGLVVASLFVNPIQFGPKEDFGHYPRQLEQDVERCAAAKVDLVFAPEVDAMYPPGFRTIVEVKELQDVLCGASRPGHFRGVATVVLKLFNIVRPDIAYFGQKDAQQVRILEQMVEDLNLPLIIRVCPIIREADGLALSSRNRFLTPDQRRQAPILHQVLEEARRRINRGERRGTTLRDWITARIQATPGAELDYAAVVDATTLQPLAHLEGTVLLALAVRFGSTRLIDNLLIAIPEERRKKKH